MGHRLRVWRTLSARDRLRLATCAALLPMIHASLALMGYRRTRIAIEALTRRCARRPADETAIENARALARLADIAGRHGAVEATCLRQSLLVYGWLRLRALTPELELGAAEAPRRFHAWVELEGTRLLPGDEAFRPFESHAP